MFDKILNATDLSEASNVVIRCAQGLRLLGSREAVLFHALRIRHLEDLKYELARFAAPQLQEQKAALGALGYAAKIGIATSETAYKLDRTAGKENISLIVIGTHGKSLLKHAILGGEATKILQHHVYRGTPVWRLQ